MHHLDYILGPPILALVFIVFRWPYARMVGGGRRLNPVQRKMLFYGFFFVLGMGYLMASVSAIGWQGKWALVLTAAWGAVLGFLVWWRSRREKKQHTNDPHPFPKVANLRNFAPAKNATPSRDWTFSTLGICRRRRGGS